MKKNLGSLLATFCILLAACTPPGNSPAPATAVPGRAPLPTIQPITSGSFTQPWTLDDYTPEKLDQEFRLMQELGMDLFIFQWTANSKDHTTIYPTRLEGWKQNSPYDQIEAGLAAAQKHNLKVFMGLAFSEEWWDRQGSDRAWLMSEAQKMNRVASEIYTTYAPRYPGVLTGWYINWEMDNVSGYTTDATQRQNMIDALNTVADHLHRLNPGLKTSIAPYFNVNEGLSAAEWGTFWQEVLTQTGIDILMLQDGVGVDHATVEDLPVWFKAVCDGAHAAGKQCWDDLENFVSESAANHPAPIQRLIRQHQAAAPYVDKIVTFSFNAAMSPLFGNDPKVLEAYRAYVAAQK